MTRGRLDARVRGAQLLQKSEDEDHEQRQNEVFWKIDVGATDKAVDGAPLDRGARAGRRALANTAVCLLSVQAWHRSPLPATPRPRMCLPDGRASGAVGMPSWPRSLRLCACKKGGVLEQHRSLTHPANQQQRRARPAAGVRASDGDGTVPLLSLGSLCARHWREPRLNPSGIRVVTREFPHEPVYGLGELRCGARAAQIASRAPAAPGEMSYRAGSLTPGSAARARECDVLQCSCCAQCQLSTAAALLTRMHLASPRRLHTSPCAGLRGNQTLKERPGCCPGGLPPLCAPGQGSCGAAAFAAHLSGPGARGPAARR
jgi:hypothetical protein